MIGLIFQKGTELIEVRIQEFSLLFRTNQIGSTFAPLENLRLDKAGCIKENPDLQDRDDWKEETIKRLRDKLKKMETEMDRAKYVIEDLSKYGYKPYAMQKAGMRVVKF